jgi:hypothetical protein
MEAQATQRRHVCLRGQAVNRVFDKASFILIL